MIPPKNRLILKSHGEKNCLILVKIKKRHTFALANHIPLLFFLNIIHFFKNFQIITITS